MYKKGRAISDPAFLIHPMNVYSELSSSKTEGMTVQGFMGLSDQGKTFFTRESWNPKILGPLNPWSIKDQTEVFT